MSSKVVIRPTTVLPAAQLREAASMLARAFDDGPLFQSAFPVAASRAKVLQALFTASLKDAMRFGRVEVASGVRIVGVLIWYRSGGYPIPAGRVLRLASEYARAVAACPRGIMKLFRAQQTFNRIRPTQPHYHALFIGACEGEHAGTELAKFLLKEADRAKMPIYLETQERRTVQWYGRLGFTVLQEGIEVFPGAPATWTMWREPGARAKAKPCNADQP
jgi:hypothetical protein